MNVYIPDRLTRTLDAKMAELKGRGAKITADKIAQAVEDGNRRDRLAGVDRFGRRLTSLRSPRKGEYRGKTGPPLAPSGASSRVVTNFRADARRRGGQWRIIAGWVGILSDRGVPFLGFHLVGAGRNPIRDIAGISPRTWVDLRKVVADFKSRVKKAR